MRWAAANVSQSLSQLGTEGEPRHGRRGSSETVEAALARLTKAYSTAISCVGAIHKLQAASMEDASKMEEFRIESKKLVTAARCTFEKAILLDPLIAKFAPTWTSVVVNELAVDDNSAAAGEETKWSFVTDVRPEPAVLTSSSHKTTIKEIAYLSLLNYSDLLVASQKEKEHKKEGVRQHILDTGVIKSFVLVGWEDCTDQQLALVALCDAVDLDGSDPVVWLKLACAARRYSRLVSGENGKGRLRYKRLERHALEMGKTALPPTVAPNRSIMRALREHESLPDYYHDDDTNEMQVDDDNKAIKLALDLPRYSWSILGRLLIRACREGVDPNSKQAFGSPCVELHLSPMLVLPQRSLGVICKFLENEDIWKFEASCRGLSANILSARALLEREEAAEQKSSSTEDQGEEEEEPKSQPPAESQEPSPIAPPNRALEEPTVPGSGPEDRADEPARSRSSKRVLSQLITSGKRAERESKRSSIRFCLLASTLHCTTEDAQYRKARGDGVNWERLYNSSTSDTSKATPQKTQGHEGPTVDSRLSDACLTAFIAKWSSNNSGPFDILQRYVAHVALNVAGVFESDQGSLALSGFVTECVDLLAKRAGICHNVDLCSYGKLDLAPGCERACIDYFSVNLLNAELRLKRSDGQLPGFGDYDADSNYIAVVVPQLLDQATEIDDAHASLHQSKVWATLKTRLHWLAAGFYLDRSRLSQNISESRLAEDCGMEQVENTIKCLSLPAGAPVSSVQTPHLTSPRRTGAHWKVLSMSSLTSYRDDMQASSVVSGARQQFLEKLTEIEANWKEAADKSLRKEDLEGLQAVGETLFQRYHVSYQGDGGKHEELIDDFVTACAEEIGDNLKFRLSKSIGEQRWGNLWALAPCGEPYIGRIMTIPNPSILTILMTCLNASAEGKLSVAKLITRLAVFSFDLLSKHQKSSKIQSTDDEFENMSDDDMLSDEETDTPSRQGQGNLSGKGRDDGHKESLIAVAAEFFVDKVAHIFTNNLTALERKEYISSDDCLSLIRSSLSFVSNWYKPRGSRKSSPTSGNHDLRIFVSMCSFNQAITRSRPATSQVTESEMSFFKGLCRILIFQRHVFPIVLGPGNDSRFGRSAKQKEFLGRAELVGVLLGEFAILLSHHLSTVRHGCLQRSSLIREVLSEAIPSDSTDALSLVSVVEALLYLWNVVPRDDTSTIGSVMGRIFSETMLVPIGASIVALCGSALSSQADSSTAETLALTEFFDSDASMNEYDSDEEAVISKTQKHMGLLQPLCQAIQCISLIVDKVDERLSLRFSPKSSCEQDLGPLFPLVSTRVLSLQADILLSELGDKKTDESVWQNYTYGTRTIGRLLDESLHKVYKQLYGITIVSHWMNQDKEKSCDDKSHSVKQPESTKAAAQLYRCIQRAYATSRKSIPKAALECVALALPEGEASARLIDMRSFVFSKETKSSSPRSISRLVANENNWDESFQSWFEAAKQLESKTKLEDSEDEILMVRRGIAKELAQASLPNISHAGTDTARGTKVLDTQKIAEERARAGFQERELSKKFWAIIDDMSYGDPAAYEGWLRAAECATLKAELIADRLGLSLGFVRASDFSIPLDSTPRSKPLFSLADLEESQEREFLQSSMGWTPFIGDDLSIYLDNQWSTFKSLENCAGAVSTKYRELATQICNKTIDDESPEFSETRVWNEIEVLRRKKDLIGWQQAWGGMFVQALRTVASRCLSMGFFLIGKSAGTRKAEETSSLQSEVLERLGIAKYTELMASQGYGYPMRVVVNYRKRELATAAQKCFEEAAIKVADDNDQVTYDMLFMVGKCYEKIAKTYAAEAFPAPSESAVIAPRSYARNIEHALSFYNQALEEAATLEEEGALPDIQAGGSSHGKTEVLYRLHASRLKCLIASVQFPENLRQQAQIEVVSLTAKYWYAPSNASGVTDSDPSAALWTVLADIVTALAQCRLDHQFFHRSVYRYAQALMWAPALHDASTGLVSGSLGMVPATRSHLLRGLNSSTPCVNSAEVVMAVLFERKRPQLVSVWVTNASSDMSPFEVLNSSARKFDSLRGKYFHGYVQTLNLCGRDSTLESLFQQVVATKRDLPSFYQASALACGSIPVYSHLSDNLLKKTRPFHTVGLLRDAKREVNRALADVLLKEAPKNGAKNDYLKKCYACFLRLNATVDQIAKMRSWKYNSSSLPEAEALCQVYLSRPDSQKIKYEPSNWSGESKKTMVLKGAIKTCSELFPTLVSTLYRKSKPKKSTGATEGSKIGDREEGANKKRQNPDSADTDDKPVHFVVDVPPGLEVGDKFETTIRLGTQMKTLRLTVPVGLPPKLKFSLKPPPAMVADEGNVDPDSKRLKVNDM